MSQQVVLRTLVSAKWLSEAIHSSLLGAGLRVLDTSWYLPKMKRDPRREFRERHIPGAVFFDIEACSDRTSPYDHMLPSEDDFSGYVGKLGIGNGTHVVVYDSSDQGSYSAPRVWWMFRVFGHKTVSLLDGGLKNWLKEDYPVSSGITRPTPTEFKAKFDQSQVKTHEDIVENMETHEFQVVDARSEGRFRGIEQEPREGIEPGHIPGAVNMPYFTFLTESGYKKNPDEISQMFQQKGIDISKPIVASCGSGVTACHVALATFLCGKQDTAVYDGSWVEWYMRAKPEDVVSEGRGKTL
uniref:3-mercaptopyruvate sulfurtransferase-like n=1 Tax=Geotrypetes seraphini TaxID=260995 RepID=A0A6P8PP92_GEOSA|nr:3-mercaptopyruvate sulfurtransferase-like [Geotrypetes seraphini]XP_033785772.1 3-mercaptopyruvate sulfurtransferase-like [Geotrypetes seraphini]XP_033785774.1 3-mercaptopyruvate sulfurtransferase-like [Geotrypetes seraphini]